MPEATIEKKEHNRWGRDLAVLVAALSVLYGFMLGNRSLSVPDEGRYVEISREMVVTGDYLTPRLNNVKYFEKPPLFYWLEAAAIKLFGLSEGPLRFWPALFALFGCLAVYGAGRRLFDRRTGLISATVLGTSLLYYALSRAVILDMPVTVLLTASLLSFLLGAREPLGMSRRLYFLCFYAFAALATLTKGLIGVVIPGMVIAAWMLTLNEWRTLRSSYLLSGAIIFLLLAAPWHVLVSRANPEFINFYFIHEHLQRYLTKVHGRYQPAWYFIPVLLAGFLPWSAFLVQAVRHNLPASWKERREHRDTVFLFLWAGLVFLFFSASSSKLMPYILPMFPPLSLLIGRYLSDSLDRQDDPGVRAGYAVFLAAALVLGGAFLVLPSFARTADVQEIGSYRYAFALTLVGGAGAAWTLARHRGFRHAFIAVLATSVLFLAEANAVAPRVDTKSIKTVAFALKRLLMPGNEVASYQEYYQDLPVYLERRITVVDWRGELDFGAAVEDTSAWMMEGRAFWKRWNGPSTIYLVMKAEKYDVLRRDRNIKLYPVLRDQSNILLANREVKQ